MSVLTINVNDFLTEKKDGEFVTAAEWNKLVALFRTINHNANALLDTNKAVDVNKANIAQLTLGAVPDESISHSKLTKRNTITSTYEYTTDGSPVSEKTYYVIEDGVYIAKTNLVSFDADVEYYELVTKEAGPAINSTDVIGDKVITGVNVADETLNKDHFVYNILGQLLKNCSINTYTQNVTVKQSETTVEFVLDKVYDTVIICTGTELILLRAGDTKVFGIGGTHSVNWGSVLDVNSLKIQYSEPSNLQYLVGITDDDGDKVSSYTNLGGHIRTKVLDVRLNDKTITYKLKSLAYTDLTYNFPITVLGL